MRRVLYQCTFALLSLTMGSAAFAQERWFQIEVSIFTNENISDRIEEQWQADRTNLSYPANLRRINKLSDVFLTDNLVLRSSENFIEENTEQLTPEEIQALARAESIAAIGPVAATDGSGFKLFDFQREDFLQLPMAESDFQQTNRTLERSGDHRLLFHGLWRQAVVQADNSTPVYIAGGLTYGDQHELQGSVTIRFNENEDRVVIDTNLWLTEFSIVENEENQWTLPAIPDSINTTTSDQSSALRYYPVRVYHMEQSREMRSTEFHYLDHPAMGLVILVEPYEVPEVPFPDNGF